MENRSDLLIWLVIWVGICFTIVRSQWSQKIPSVGLPFAYLLTLSMIHFVGGLIYSFPWYEPKSVYLLQSGSNYFQVSAGFIETVYGVIGFGIGSIIVSSWVLKKFKPKWLNQVPQKPNLQLPNNLLKIGLIFMLVITPILGRIPGLQGFSVAGVYLIVVGLCLACWREWYKENRKGFLFWIVVSCSLPIITMITLGFIGYGASATAVVLVFVSSFYRPQWQTIVIACLVFVLGLSVYVTYMRDRGEIRATVWGGQALESRAERLINTFTNFEIIDIYNQEHLEAIDTRLNQNGLVGKTVENIERGNAKFAKGETLWQAALAPIPRLIWADKPIFGGSGNLVSLFTGQKFADGTSVGVGQVLEYYINFGTWGVFIGFMIFGVIIRIIDVSAGVSLVNGNWWGFTSWFLPGLAMLQPGGALAEVTASTAASVVVIFITGRLIPKNHKDTTKNTMNDPKNQRLEIGKS
ncbi:hypothetical protein ACN4EE_22785 [Geminocystis sp. CENA526]|uniref:hypothetical protein n=1 Tax=Geminocystis sp. CENA526 TaxID=1355871 RepID=UPI003D6DDE0E